MMKSSLFVKRSLDCAGQNSSTSTMVPHNVLLVHDMYELTSANCRIVLSSVQE